MDFLPVFFLALAVSMDSFNVGFTYGLRNINIPFHSILIIAFCSGLVLYCASLFGTFFQSVLSVEATHMIGGIILISLGIWAIIQFFKTSKEHHLIANDDREVDKKEEILVKFEIKAIGVVIQILKKPIKADFDNSGTINGWEAVFLGLALSLDAFGAGIGSSMLGFSPIILAISVGFMSSLFAFLGIKTGKFLVGQKWIRSLAFLPGLLLICIGIWKF